MHVDNYIEKMEPKQQHAPNKSSPLFQQAQRDVRGSLEVFNPSTNEVIAPLRSQPTWQTWAESPQINLEPPPPPPQQQSSEDINENVDLLGSHSDRLPADEITSWMALKDPYPPQTPPFTSTAAVGPQSSGGVVGAAELRAAEWGLVLQKDTETGKPQGVKVRTSAEDPNAKPGSSRRDSGNSVQSSSDVSDDGLGK